MDLNDLQKNVVDGVHAANMGGSWLSLIYGFAGLAYDRGLHLANHLPQKIESLTFTITYQQEAIKVKLQGEKSNASCCLTASCVLSKRGMDFDSATNHDYRCLAARRLINRIEPEPPQGFSPAAVFDSFHKSSCRNFP